MNLIVNRPLDRAQKQVIYELTLKKRQSKKSTMSERQVAARQQLARELRELREQSTFSSTTSTIDLPSTPTLDDVSSTSSEAIDASSASSETLDASTAAALEEARRKEALIRLNKTRLQHLNSELEKKLNQYEYLVAQEKAILGAHNLLVNGEGVNNIHLFDAR